MPNSSVLIYCDVADVALELVTLARKLGATDISLCAINSDATSNLSVEGIGAIYRVSNDSLNSLLAEPLTDALEAVYNQVKPGIVLIGATKRGREVAPRLATRLRVGCITDVSSVDLSENGTKADRLVWGGNAVATVASKGGVVLTVPPRANEKTGGKSDPKIIEVIANINPSKVKIIGKKEKPPGQVSIKDAEVIVSAGRGFKKKEDLALLDGLAATIHGVVGASRPLTSDLRWMPEERQVGLSGTTVKPKLYIAVGISGQIQHLTGMRDSKIIVAINTDKNAPIFQECDYGVVGDLYAVVPELEKSLKAQLG